MRADPPCPRVPCARKEKTLLMIGNAHIDPVWLWRWEEGFHEVQATFRSALDRMGENPDFIFTAGSAALYEWVEKGDPAMFDEIRAAGGRRPLGHRRRLVGAAGLQHPVRRIVRPAGAIRPAVLSREARRSPPRSATTWTASGTTACCRRSWRKVASRAISSCARHRTKRNCRVTSSGGSRTTDPACWRFASCTGTHRGARGWKSTCGAAPGSCGSRSIAPSASTVWAIMAAARRVENLEQHRGVGRRSSPPAPAIRRARSLVRRCAGSATSRCPCCTTTCSTTPAAATPRTLASSAGTGKRRTR